jgi:hypothetical protein
MVTLAHKVNEAHKVRKVLKVPLGKLVMEVLQVKKVQEDHKALLVQVATRVLLVHKAVLDQLVPRVLQAL